MRGASLPGTRLAETLRARVVSLALSVELGVGLIEPVLLGLKFGLGEDALHLLARHAQEVAAGEGPQVFLTESVKVVAPLDTQVLPPTPAHRLELESEKAGEALTGLPLDVELEAAHSLRVREWPSVMDVEVNELDLQSPVPLLDDEGEAIQNRHPPVLLLSSEQEVLLHLEQRQLVYIFPPLRFCG